MRITNNMVTRNYTKTLHSNRSALDKYSNQIVTGQRFKTMAGDTSAGVRTMQVRRSVAAIDAHLDNAKAAKSYIGAAETTLIQLSNISHSASEKFVQGISDTCGATERKIIATELTKLRDEMLALANGRFSDRYMFGGTNTVTAPFTTDDVGTLYYNGTNVHELSPGHPLMTDAAYMDIGLKVLFTDENDPTQVNPNTAFKHTLVGMDFLGEGSENIYLILGDMIDTLNAGTISDKDAAGRILDRFNASASSVNVAITNLGSDAQYLDFTINRLETERVNLLEKQSDLEAAAPEEAIMNFKLQEYVYNAALQMGQRLLQPTLFSFIS